MSNVAPPEAKPSSRVPRLLLIASLGLNVLVVGAVAGAVIFGGNWQEKRKGILSQVQGGPFGAALAEEDRKLVLRQMRQAMRVEELSPKQVRQEMIYIVEDLRAEPFDIEAVAEHMGIVRDRLQRGMDVVVPLFLEHYETMGAEDRRAYADRLEEIIRKHKID